MTALDFPNTPTQGQVFDQWRWDGTAWVTHGSVYPVPTPSGGDDTAEIQAALDAAKTARGVVELGAGTFLAKGLVIDSNVWLRGHGTGATTLKLLDGANTDLLITKDFATLTGGATMGGPYHFRLTNLTLDGNRANNTSGWPLRIYGRAYTIDNLVVQEGKSGGIWSQWGTGGTDMESFWSNFKIKNCEGTLLDFYGPHDSILMNGSVLNDGTQPLKTGRLIHTGVGDAGTQWTNIHVWGNCATAIDIEASGFWVNCQAEGATNRNVWAHVNYVQWTGGHIFGTVSGTEVGIEFGEFGIRSAKGCRFENVLLSRFNAGSFPIKWNASAGNNVINGMVGFNVASTALSTGTAVTAAATADRVDLRSPDTPALAQSWQVPTDQANRIWIPATDFFATGGTPVLAGQASTPVFLFDATTLETVTTTLMLPPWWKTAKHFIRWTNTAGGAGTVKWAIRYDVIAAGETLTTFTSLFPAAQAAPLVNVVADTIGGGDLVNTSGAAIVVRIDRDATNDDLPNDAAFIGVEFLRVT